MLRKKRVIEPIYVRKAKYIKEENRKKEMTISLCMIVRDEEQCIGQALLSVQGLVDEVIVIDTGSLDSTIEKAKKYTDKIFAYKWDNNFSKARNFSLSKAAKEWILVLDADEVLGKEDHELIRALTKNKEADAYTFVQVSYTDDINMIGFKTLQKRTPEAKEFAGYISCNIIRLFRNNKGIHFTNPVHESVDASILDKERIRQTVIPIHHYQFEKGERIHRVKQLKYLKIYEEKAHEFENKAKVYRDMATINYNFKQDYETAIHLYRKSLLLNPNNITTYLGLAVAYLKNKQFEEAWKILQEAERIGIGNADVQKIKAYLKKIKPSLNA